MLRVRERTIMMEVGLTTRLFLNSFKYIMREKKKNKMTSVKKKKKSGKPTTVCHFLLLCVYN